MGELEPTDPAAVSGDPQQAGNARRQGCYEPPSITYLGTLRELTRGGTSEPNDGIGGAGGVGSL
jgi:hypothetical protein